MAGRLAQRIANWRNHDPVFIAVRDATQRFSIPLSLLDELIAGTTSDLKANPGDAPDTYATFADLYQYCYLVASVVGLVCIRIFGYTDPPLKNWPKKPASPSSSPTSCAT